VRADNGSEVRSPDMSSGSLLAVVYGVANRSGPDKHVNESIRTMSEEQLELIRIWANQILTETGPARSVTMTGNGRAHQLIAQRRQHVGQGERLASCGIAKLH